jgi:hypothetical protein
VCRASGNIQTGGIRRSPREVDDVRIVSVAFDDNPSAVEAFFRENGGGWPVLAEETGRIAVDWGVSAVPESYLVSPSGHVVVKVVGGVEAEDLESVLVGAKRSLGCEATCSLVLVLWFRWVPWWCRRQRSDLR